MPIQRLKNQDFYKNSPKNILIGSHWIVGNVHFDGLWI